MIKHKRLPVQTIRIVILFLLCISIVTTTHAGNGNALDFDGSNDYISTSTSSSLNMGNSSYTIEVWVWGNSSLNYSSERVLVEYGTWETGTYQLTSMNDDNFKTNFDGRSSAQGSECNTDWTDSS